MTEAIRIHIKGLVQGVGFRPFIYRIAIRHGLHGWVENNNEGVRIHAEGEHPSLLAFLEAIKSEAPVASDISRIETCEAGVEEFGAFRIKKSADRSDAITGVSPDIAVCDACLADMKQQPHRIDYPFINCTNCGPRFTIIRDLPYDRPMTTMAPFPLCARCREEYENILDRRFHAQPVACNHCGPEYSLHAGGETITGIHQILAHASRLIDAGGIVAMKGLGGFHLACDALNAAAVDRLREAKNRDGKPFAVMFRNSGVAEKYAIISGEERSVLTGWQRPIVLLESKRKLAQGVSMGFGTVGGMLPYLPFHYLLFEHLRQDVIVLTSGNISDEPIIISNEEAMKVLGPIADAVILNNRDIHNRADDSVLRVMNGQPRLIRRSRSWVPSPVELQLDVDGILACGAELVNCFCMGKGRQAILSQHTGDLKNAETLEFYMEAVIRFSKLFRMKPALVAHDLHPDYLSTRYAQETGLPMVAVQHHHAHIASCMAEHGLRERVIGISFDGVGMGDDGHIWGGEFMLCDLSDYERFSHLRYIPMPGGDMATKEPWRMAVSYLFKAYGRKFPDLGLPFLQKIPAERLEIVVKAIESGINTPLTSSAGRLFDAVSAIAGLCSIATFHAEAPMRLEGAIDPEEKGHYPFGMTDTVDTLPLIRALCDDVLAGLPAGRIAARFHNSVINIIFAAAEMAAARTGINKVVLSGGSFQNKYILENAERGLALRGFECYTPRNIPANDGGIALGQLVIAAARRSGIRKRISNTNLKL